MKFSSFEAYRLYISLKNHFTTEKYDFEKYHGKTKLSDDFIKKFENRTDRFKYQKLSRLYDKEYLIYFIAANMIEDVFWIDELLTEEAKKRFGKFLKNHESVTYIFESELNLLLESNKFSDLFKVKKETVPIIVNMFLGKRISIHTMIILNDMVNYVKKFDKSLSNDFIWSKVSLKIRKSKPFIQYDDKKIKNILKNRLTII